MAEMVTIKCTKCGKQFNVPDRLAGKKARCPCGTVLDVPLPKGKAPAAAPAPAREDQSPKWYYSRGGERFGPVGEAEVKALAARGELAPGDYVWTKGMAAWKPAAEVPELGVSAAPKPAAPPAAEEELEADFEEALFETTPAPAVVEAVRQLAAEGPKPAAESKAAAETKLVAEPAPAAAAERPAPPPPAAPVVTAAAAVAAPAAAAAPPMYVPAPKAPTYLAMSILSAAVGVVGLLLVVLGGLGLALSFPEVTSGAITGLLLLPAWGIMIGAGIVALAYSEMLRLVIGMRQDLWHIRRRMEEEPSAKGD